MDGPDWWKVLGALGVLGTGALVAWVNGYLGTLLPPPARVLRCVRHALVRLWRPWPAPEDGRYRLVLCGLEGDDAREGTLRLLRYALDPKEYPMLQVELSARCLSIEPWLNGSPADPSAARAERVLADHQAALVIWGGVAKQGENLRLFVRGAGRQETQTIVFDKGAWKDRPDGSLGEVLAAVALSQVAPATQEAGQFLVFRLRPVVTRLRALLAEPRLLPTAERPNLHHALGLVCSVIGEQAGDNEALKQAIVAFRAALEEWPRERVPFQWATTQNNLGNALNALGERESGTGRLVEALQAFRAALEEWTRERVPLQWATTQNNLGNALSRLGERESGTARLEEAAQAYRAALEEWTRERVPLDWAGTQSNLGNALRALGERETGTDRLAEAVSVYRAALEERTRARVPLQWAKTQNNLGNALLRLGERENGTGRLEEAVAAYRLALEEWTRERVPLDWAMTQNNLGTALSTLGERESGTGRLEEAVAACRAALEERTHERVPLDWAMTQSNLGIALGVLGEREGGTERLEEALGAIKAAWELVVDAGYRQYDGSFKKRIGQIDAIIAQRRGGDAGNED